MGVSKKVIQNLACDSALCVCGTLAELAQWSESA